MYKNLEAELMRKRMTKKELAGKLGTTPSALS